MDADERERAQMQMRQSAHQSNLAGQDDQSGEILRQLSEIDDLPIDRDDPVMGQLISKLTSTTKLSKEQITSNEWVRQYIVLLYLCKHPPQDGIHSETAVWAKDDVDAWIEPMDPERRMQLEAFVATSNLALNRSEDGFVAKEGSRNISESVVHDDGQKSSSGILGRVGLK